MPDMIKRSREQITAFWNKLTTKNKIQIISAVVVGLIALVALTIVLSKPTMIKYASGLTPQKMNQMKTALEDNEIEYKISDDASTLYIDSKRQKDVVIIADELGVLSDAEMTWEDALNNSLSTTSSEKQVKYQLAFEEELNKKIETLDSIKNAYVKLNVPKEDTTIFDESKPSSATVILETIGPLNEDQIIGIVNFLKNSVNNLQTENISIMSTTGTILYDGQSAADFAGSVNTQLEYSLSLEQYEKARLMSVLLAGGAFDDAEVAVNLKINFDEESSIAEKYEGFGDTNKGVIIKQYINENEGNNIDAGGAPGTDANDDVTDYFAANSSSSNSSSTTTDTEYVANKIVTTRTETFGDIVPEESSVTVVLSKFTKYDQRLLEEDGTLDDISWEAFKLQNEGKKLLEVDEGIVNLVKNTSKIDNVVVMAYEVPMFIDKESNINELFNYLPVVVIVLLILLLGYAVYKGTEPVEITEIEPELSVEDMLASTKENQELESIEVGEKSGIKIEIEKFVDDNPEAVASLLRNWLSEDWE